MEVSTTMFLARILTPRMKGTFVFLALCLCLGCGIRRANFRQPYRLAKFGDSDFILPPDFPPQAASAAATEVSLGKLGEPALAQNTKDCSIRDPWFSLESAKRGNWAASLPAPMAWDNEDLVSNARDYWNDFLEQIYGLASKGCITPQGYENATNGVRESMPAPAVFASVF